MYETVRRRQPALDGRDGFAISWLFHIDYDLSPRVAFFEITKCIGNFTQRFVGAINDRREFSRLHEIGEISEIIVIELRNKERESLCAELRA